MEIDDPPATRPRRARPADLHAARREGQRSRVPNAYRLPDCPRHLECDDRNRLVGAVEAGEVNANRPPGPLPGSLSTQADEAHSSNRGARMTLIAHGGNLLVD